MGEEKGTISRFKISLWNRNGGAPGVLSPEGLLGQWHFILGASPPWPGTDGTDRAHSGLCPHRSAVLYRSPSNISVRKQVSPKWGFKPSFYLFPLPPPQITLPFWRKKRPFFEHKTCYVFSRSLSLSEQCVKDLQYFLGTREKWMMWSNTPHCTTEPTGLWAAISLEGGQSVLAPHLIPESIHWHTR